MFRLDTESLDQTFITNLPETKRKLYVKIIDHNEWYDWSYEALLFHIYRDTSIMANSARNNI